MRLLVLAFLIMCNSGPPRWEQVAFKYDMNKTAYLSRIGHAKSGTLVSLAFKWSDSAQMEPASPAYAIVRCDNWTIASGENADPATWKTTDFQSSLPGTSEEAIARHVCQ